MALRTVNIRIDSEKVKELDRLAAAQQRNRGLVLNEAIDQYLSLNKYHHEQVEAGLADIKAGRFNSHESVVALTKRWRGTN